MGGASSWSEEIEPPQEYVQLRSLNGDSTYIVIVLAQIQGRLVSLADS